MKEELVNKDEVLRIVRECIQKYFGEGEDREYYSEDELRVFGLSKDIRKRIKELPVTIVEK